jgi:hypothetical protein
VPKPSLARTSGRVDEHNPVWSLAGYHADNTRSWGPISASVVTRPAGEGVWRSDYHRILYDPVGYTSTGTGTLQFENGPVRAYQYLPNQISFVPRGVMARSDRPTQVQFIQIRQIPETYDALISDMVRGGTVDLEPTMPFDDPLISQIMSTIAKEWRVVSSIVSWPMHSIPHSQCKSRGALPIRRRSH